MKLGSLDLERSDPLLAAAFADNTERQTITLAKNAGLDVAEIRIDLFHDTSVAHVLEELKKFTMPVIATIRSKKEQGGWQGSEQDRIALFRAVIPRVDAVDVELGSTDIRSEVIQAARDSGKLVILSFHDFDQTPSLVDLSSVVSNAREAGADVVKVATMAHTDADVRTLARLLVENEGGHLVVIAMGTVGIKSRVFFPALGSCITFASLNQATAPGQLTVNETVAGLRAYYPAFNQRKITELELMEAV